MRQVIQHIITARFLLDCLESIEKEVEWKIHGDNVQGRYVRMYSHVAVVGSQFSPIFLLLVFL